MHNLKQLLTFKLIVEQGSISNAARQIGISKAAASKQLIELENQLNIQLLHRTTRSIKLTNFGELYFQSLQKVFGALKDMESLASANHETPIGTLRVVSHRHFGEKYILSYLKEFMELYPLLKLDLELSDRFPDLEKENIDVLCGAGMEGPEHLVRRRLSSVHHVLCGSKEYFANFGIPNKPQDLKQHRYITHSFRNPDNIVKFKNNQEIHLDYHLRLNDAQAMLQCALQGLGIIKIYNYFVEDYIKEGKLIEVLARYREPIKTIYLFYQPQTFVQLKIRIFIDFILNKMNIK